MRLLFKAKGKLIDISLIALLWYKSTKILISGEPISTQLRQILGEGTYRSGARPINCYCLTGRIFEEECSDDASSQQISPSSHTLGTRSSLSNQSRIFRTRNTRILWIKEIKMVEDYFVWSKSASANNCSIIFNRRVALRSFGWQHFAWGTLYNQTAIFYSWMILLLF